MPNRGVREITEPIELAIVDDRLFFTCVSGSESWTFSASLHKARNAAMGANYLLDRVAAREPAKVLPFGKHGRH